MRNHRLSVVLACALVAGLPGAAMHAQSPAPDAAAILDGAIDALLATDSFHVRDDISSTVTMTGPAPSPGTGFVEGDVSLSGPQADLTYDWSLLGGVGEMRIASDGNTYTRLAGAHDDLWHRASTSAFDIGSLAAQARALVAMPGAEVTMSGSVPCPAAAANGVTATCEAIHLAIPGSILGMGGGQPSASETPGMPSAAPSSVQLDALIDGATMLPDTITLTTSLPGMGSGQHLLSFTRHGLAVDAAPPPPSQVTDEPFSTEDVFPGASPTS